MIIRRWATKWIRNGATSKRTESPFRLTRSTDVMRESYSLQVHIDPYVPFLFRIGNAAMLDWSLLFHHGIRTLWTEVYQGRLSCAVEGMFFSAEVFLWFRSMPSTLICVMYAYILCVNLQSLLLKWKRMILEIDYDCSCFRGTVTMEDLVVAHSKRLPVQFGFQ